MAKLSHRQRYFADGPDIGKDRPSPKPIFADGKAIGKPEPSANTNLCRRPGHRQRPTIGKIGPGQTSADAVPFADGLAVRPSAKGKAMPTAAAIGIDRPRGRLRSCRAHRLCRWLAIGKPTLPTALTCRRHSLNFFLFFQPIFFLVPSYIKYNPTSKVGTILSFLAIFR